MASTGRPCAAILGEGGPFCIHQAKRVEFSRSHGHRDMLLDLNFIFLCSRHMYILKATVSRCCRTFGEEKLACNKMADISLFFLESEEAF